MSHYVDDDVPSTPFLEAPPSPNLLQVPSSGVRRRSGGSVSSNTNLAGSAGNAGNSDNNSKRNKTAFAGICVFGGIIIIALIIVAIKEGTTPSSSKVLKLHSSDKLNEAGSDAKTNDRTVAGHDAPSNIKLEDIPVSKGENDLQSEAEVVLTSTTTSSDSTTDSYTTTEEEALNPAATTAVTVEEETTTEKLDAAELCNRMKGMLSEKIDSGDQKLVEEFDCSSYNLNGTAEHDISLAKIESLLDGNTEIQDLVEEIKDSAWMDKTKVIGDFFTNLILTGREPTKYHDLKEQIDTLMVDSDSKEPDSAARALGSIPVNSSFARVASLTGLDEEVFCDPRRERRCRDKTQCYHVARHCDFQIDCKDYSDEDNCTCTERLIDERFCDGYADCLNAEDEADCNCGEDKFFCKSESLKGDLECIRKDFVCDGVSDCSNGRDEEDCLLLAPPSLAMDFQPSEADKTGLLSVKFDGKHKYLGIREADEEHLPSLAAKACYGLLDLDGVKYDVVELEIDPEYVVLLSDFDSESRFKVESAIQSNDHFHLVHVDCILKPCLGFKERTKRAHDMAEELFKLSSEDISAGIENGTISKPNGTDARIIGGIIADEQSWPSTVAIYRNQEFICGGSLISSLYIITAAHCLQQYSTNNYYYRVRLGMMRKQAQSPWEQNRFVRKVFIHDDYESFFLRHDVAIGQLDRPVGINKFVQPACLPATTLMTPEPGQSCTAAGWGVLSENGLPSEVLKEINLAINAQCKSSFNNISYQICAGSNRGEDTCQGDSGGPLYCIDRKSNERYLAGVVSHGMGCAREGQPGVYVRLSTYLDWIVDVISGTNTRGGDPLVECPGLQCGSGECVPEDKMCNLTVACLDNMDVKHCAYMESGQIPPPDYMQKTDDEVKDGSSGVHFEVVNPDHDHDHESDDDETELYRDGNEYQMSSVECSSDQFSCTLLSQCVPKDSVCDGELDCYDRSDETDCTCGMMLARSHPEYVNDGYKDCEDGSDETEDTCGADKYRCPRSTKCIERSQLCDAKVDCAEGDDEKNCFALVDTDSGDNLDAMASFKNSTGYLIIKGQGVWSSVCLNTFPDDLGNRICSYMGYTELVSKEFIPKEQSLLSTMNIRHAENSNCYHLKLDCGTVKCGDRSIFRQAGLTADQVPSTGSLAYPWSVSLFSNGVYYCGGTIIHKSFVLTSYACGVNLLTPDIKPGESVHVTAMAGQDRKTLVGFSPDAQIRKIVKFSVIPQTQIVIGYLEDEFYMTNQVGKLCLTSATWIPQGVNCKITGSSPNEWITSFSTQMSGVCSFASDQVYSLCSCSHPGIPKQSYCDEKQATSPNTTDWSGALACPDNSGNFYAIGLFYSNQYEAPTMYENLIAEATRNGIPSLIRTTLADVPKSADDECSHRCKLGNCVASTAVCDGHWDCADGSDELHCRPKTSWPVCKQNGTDNERCICPKGYGKCNNNLCIPIERYCDGTDDCGDSTDETDSCKLCVNRIRFTDERLLCDGHVNCEDGSDEAPEMCGCPANTFRCSGISGFKEDSTECLPEKKICDSKDDCPSGIDEDPKMCIALDRFSSSEEDVKNNPSHPVENRSGYLKFRLQGQWYFYCHEKWNKEWSEEICRQLGYPGLQMWLQHLPVKVEDLGEQETGLRSQKSKRCQIIHIVCSEA